MQICSQYTSLSVHERWKEKLRRAKLELNRRDHKNLIFTNNFGLESYIVPQEERSVSVSNVERYLTFGTVNVRDQKHPTTDE